jgi:hypothetical protein
MIVENAKTGARNFVLFFSSKRWLVFILYMEWRVSSGFPPFVTPNACSVISFFRRVKISSFACIG